MGSTQEASQKTPHTPKVLPQHELNSADPPEALQRPIQTLAYLRIWHILGDKKANPPIAPLLPISRSSFYDGIKRKIYPAPLKLSQRVSVWRMEDIRALLESRRIKNDNPEKY